MPLLNAKPVYKPFEYPWAYDAWLLQNQLHWLPQEVPLADDVKDWKNKLTPSEINLLTQIFRLFTQSDIEVNNCYMKRYARIFKPTEINMMLSAFSATECIHIAAYSYLLDTIGMPETEYSAFLQYEEMKNKVDYLRSITNSSRVEDIALTMAVFGAFTEGLQLFASFAILLNFPRHNKMKGMGQIITWSVRDETLHATSIIRLHNQLISESGGIDMAEYSLSLTKICNEIVRLEDAFIDLAFKMGDVDGLSSGEVKRYIRYIANRRLRQLNVEPIYSGLEDNPLPWMDSMLNGLEHMNFFENRATEYSKGSTRGTWDEAFD